MASFLRLRRFSPVPSISLWQAPWVHSDLGSITRLSFYITESQLACCVEKEGSCIPVWSNQFLPDSSQRAARSFLLKHVLGKDWSYLQWCTSISLMVENNCLLRHGLPTSQGIMDDAGTPRWPTSAWVKLTKNPHKVNFCSWYLGQIWPNHFSRRKPNKRKLTFV